MLKRKVCCRYVQCQSSYREKIVKGTQSACTLVRMYISGSIRKFNWAE